MQGKLRYIGDMKFLLIPLCALTLTACATSSETGVSKTLNTKHAQPKLAHPDATPFLAQADAKSDVAQALRKARTEDKYGLIVMGANWCHDSRALAGYFETQKFQTLLQENYSLVYVDVGKKDKNIDVAESFGLENIVGTPTVIVTTPSGKVLNLEDAPSWRNAASRNEDDIYTYFARYVGEK
ncbi:MAG: thioredoxin family protein [Litorimonas sp.]